MGKAKILTASAGAGKTYQLAYKYVSEIIACPEAYRNILAVTFTNKATEEMKNRILDHLNALAAGKKTPFMEDLLRDFGQFDAQTIRHRAKEARTRILHDYGRFTVLTIDKFFQRIMRAFLKELNLDLNYNIQIETETILENSVDRLVDSISDDTRLRKWLLAFTGERLSDSKRWDIRDTIGKLGEEIFKEKDYQASPISKEELEKRMGRALAQNRKIEEQMAGLANQALAIMDEYALRPTDFKGSSRSFALYFETAAKTFAEPSTSARKAADAGPDESWAAAKSPLSKTIDTAKLRLQPILRQMCDLYDRECRRYNTTLLFQQTFRSYALLSDLYEKVLARCDETGDLLLSQTKNILSEFIEDNEAPFIYEKVGSRFEYFMIDEFQDTSRREWRNFLPLLRNSMAQSDRIPVFIVGDVKQSIYRWRGSDWRILDSKVPEDLGPENILQQNLADNRRSLPLIVRFNNAMIGHVVGIDSEAITRTLEAACTNNAINRTECDRLSTSLSNAYRNHIQIPRRQSSDEGYVSIIEYGVDSHNDLNQNPPLVPCIERLLGSGYRPSDILILARTNNEGEKIATQLLEYLAGPDARFRFDVITQDAMKVGYAAVNGFIIACLRTAVNQNDPLNRITVNKFLRDRGLKTPLDDSFDPVQVQFFHELGALSPEDAFERIAMQYRLNDDPAATAYIQALHELIVKFCTNRVADIRLFLEWWDEKGYKTAMTSQKNDHAIEISTIHKAKGLERKAVIIPYCSWDLKPTQNPLVWVDSDESHFAGIGQIPIYYGKTMGNSEFAADFYRETVYSHIDSINLLYVALTRAAEQLYIMYKPPKETKKQAEFSKISTVISQVLSGASHTPEGSILLPAAGDSAQEGLEGRISERDNCRIIEFGEMRPPVHESSPRTADTIRLSLEKYETYDCRSRLKTRLPMSRYFEEGGSERLSSLNLGIAMHRIFEQASDLQAVHDAIDDMRRNSRFSQQEAAVLTSMIDKAMQNPVIEEWFRSGYWDSVRNEAGIIMPGSGIYRPDRVMTRGRRAVIVDYKFGMNQKNEHFRQVERYAGLLREMGYRQVEGWLWYIALDRLVRVEEAMPEA